MDFRYTDLEDDELVTLIDMIVDSRDVYSQHKFDIGQTKQNFHFTLKPNSELRKQQPCKCLLNLKDKLEKLLGQFPDSGIIREMGDDDELEHYPLTQSYYSQKQIMLNLSSMLDI